ncbi:hypothetical protein Btru_053192 [Bulinus truncatus]|nr:hypothetical protein Btru_053192 [Bulinus truncatus]
MMLLYCSQPIQASSGDNDNKLSLPKSFEVPKSLVYHYYNYYNKNAVSIEGLEEMFEQSGAHVLEKLGGVMNQVVQSKDQMMKRLDNVMGRVSESMLESKERVIKGFDSVMDKMSESKSKMMEEIDYVLDNLAHSKVMEDIRALPREIKESFVLSVRNKSYIAAGIMVAMTTAVLIAGALYYAWCHQDNWNYCIVPLEEIPHSADYVIKQMNTKFADGSAVKCYNMIHFFSHCNEVVLF